MIIWKYKYIRYIRTHQRYNERGGGTNYIRSSMPDWNWKLPSRLNSNVKVNATFFTVTPESNEIHHSWNSFEIHQEQRGDFHSRQRNDETEERNNEGEMKRKEVDEVWFTLDLRQKERAGI